MRTAVPISSCFAAPTVTMEDIVTFPVSEASSLLKWSTVSPVSPVPRWKEQLVRGSKGELQNQSSIMSTLGGVVFITLRDQRIFY